MWEVADTLGLELTGWRLSRRPHRIVKPEAGTLTSPGKGARGHWLGRPVTSWPWQGRSREHIPPHTRPGVPNIPFQKKVHTG